MIVNDVFMFSASSVPAVLFAVSRPQQFTIVPVQQVASGGVCAVVTECYGS